VPGLAGKITVRDLRLRNNCRGENGQRLKGGGPAACTREGQLLFAGNGYQQYMANVNGYIIANPQFVTDRLMTVTYTARPQERAQNRTEPAY